MRILCPALIVFILFSTTAYATEIVSGEKKANASGGIATNCTGIEEKFRQRLISHVEAAETSANDSFICLSGGVIRDSSEHAKCPAHKKDMMEKHESFAHSQSQIRSQLVQQQIFAEMSTAIVDESRGKTRRYRRFLDRCVSKDGEVPALDSLTVSITGDMQLKGYKRLSKTCQDKSNIYVKRFLQQNEEGLLRAGATTHSEEQVQSYIDTKWSPIGRLPYIENEPESQKLTRLSRAMFNYKSKLSSLKDYIKRLSSADLYLLYRFDKTFIEFAKTLPSDEKNLASSCTKKKFWNGDDWGRKWAKGMNFLLELVPGIGALDAAMAQSYNVTGRQLGMVSAETFDGVSKKLGISAMFNMASLLPFSQAARVGNAAAAGARGTTASVLPRTFTQKQLQAHLARTGNMNATERVSEAFAMHGMAFTGARGQLGRALAVMEAHTSIAAGKAAGTLTNAELVAKVNHLVAAGWTKQQARNIVRTGVAGNGRAGALKIASQEAASTSGQALRTAEQAIFAKTEMTVAEEAATHPAVRKYFRTHGAFTREATKEATLPINSNLDRLATASNYFRPLLGKVNPNAGGRVRIAFADDIAAGNSAIKGMYMQARTSSAALAPQARAYQFALNKPVAQATHSDYLLLNQGYNELQALLLMARKGAYAVDTQVIQGVMQTYRGRMIQIEGALAF